MATMLMMGNLSVASFHRILQPSSLQLLGGPEAAQQGLLVYGLTLLEMKLITSSDTVFRLLANQQVWFIRGSKVNGKPDLTYATKGLYTELV